MKKAVLIIEGMSEPEVLRLMESPKLKGLLFVMAQLLKVDSVFFGSGNTVPLSEVEPHFRQHAASMN